jgi:hypothetical protein
VASIVITAIVRMRGSNSSFWDKDSTVGLPSVNLGLDIPGQPAGSAFLVMAIQRLPGPRGVPAVNQILITGSGINPPRCPR